MKIMKRSLLLVAVILLSSVNSFADNCNEVTKRWGYVTTITCSPDNTVISGRDVYYKLPEGEVPSSGWPVVIDFTGTSVKASTIWSAKSNQLSKYNHVKVIRELLDRGYAVIAPSSSSANYWNTNSDVWVNDDIGDNYFESDDHYLLTNSNGLFAMIDNHPDLDGQSKFAMGISSGGYMADRMGHSHYQDDGFKALAVQSGGFATWSGSNQKTDPRDYNLVAHPPTLFLHCRKDRVVPSNLMEEYASYLGSVIGANNVAVAIEEKAMFPAHRWIRGAEIRIADWFDDYR